MNFQKNLYALYSMHYIIIINHMHCMHAYQLGIINKLQDQPITVESVY